MESESDGDGFVDATNQIVVAFDRLVPRWIVATAIKKPLAQLDFDGSEPLNQNILDLRRKLSKSVYVTAFS